MGDGSHRCVRRLCIQKIEGPALLGSAKMASKTTTKQRPLSQISQSEKDHREQVEEMRKKPPVQDQSLTPV